VVIRPFDRSTDTDAVVALWHASGLTRPWNDPIRDIDTKLTEQPELFVVASEPDGSIIGTAMAGFDGHRGWVYYLATAESHRRAGIARALLTHLEDRLIEVGCPKIDVMVRTTNADVLGFYDRLGYGTDDVVVRSKRLIADADPSDG
jgi:ribosomal protein S18 acetylase RimI-like enzyme